MRGERAVIIVSAGILVVAAGTAFMIMGLTRNIGWLLDTGVILVVSGFAGGLISLKFLWPDSFRRFAETTPKEIGQIMASHSTIQGQKLLKPYRNQWLRVEAQLEDVSEWHSGFSMVTTARKPDEPDVTFFFTNRKVVERRLFGIRPGSKIVVVGKIEEMKYNSIRFNRCKLESVETENCLRTDTEDGEGALTTESTKGGVGVRQPEVEPEDLRKHGDEALLLVRDLHPGESIRWADAVNTTASIAEIEEQDQ